MLKFTQTVINLKTNEQDMRHTLVPYTNISKASKCIGGISSRQAYELAKTGRSEFEEYGHKLILELKPISKEEASAMMATMPKA